ncbi:MAG: hypothetical protein JWQ35_2722, partial [Bacteriovoracaceae bacterium]|nr:hypothetical protein [Bacteriovoracaceae bacterium]
MIASHHDQNSNRKNSKRMRIVELLLFASISVFILITDVSAQTYYVSTSGSDLNTGTSSSPFRTITKAYNLATPGTTILVAPGTYTDYQSAGWGLHLNRSGTASAPIVLKSQIRGKAIIDGEMRFDRIRAIYLDGSYNIIDGFQITRGARSGIDVVDAASNNQIIRNEIHHNGNYDWISTNGQDGIYSSESTSNNIYLQNYIHDNGRPSTNSNYPLDHGLYLCGDNELVANNIVVKNAGNGLQIAGYTTVSNMRVYNNVFASNGTNGIILWMALNGVQIKNNIFFQNVKLAISSYDAHGSGIAIDRNISFGNGLGNYDLARGGSDFIYTATPPVISDPLFINNASDFHLQSASPAINAGIALTEVTTDLEGVSKPQGAGYDIGAYEFIPPTSPTCNTTSNLWNSVAIAPQNGSFSLEFDATPNNDLMNGGMALSQNPAATYTDLATIIRFNPSGNIDVRNGGAYQAQNIIPYRASTSYHFRIDAIMAKHIYSAYVTPSGGSPLAIATNIAYRTEQASVPSLNYVSTFADTGSMTVCNAVINPMQAPATISLDASAGTIQAPLYLNSTGAIQQDKSASVIDINSGSATYSINIPVAGNYVLDVLVNAPNENSNSFWLNIDAQPLNPTMIWDVTALTTGFETRTVSLRGNGTVTNNQ